MAHIGHESYVKETTTTATAGDITLAGARSPGRTVSSVCADGDTFEYAISHTTANEFEEGLGTYHTSGNTFTRTTVYESSNAGALVTFSAGVKNVDLVVGSRRIAEMAGIAMTKLLGAYS